MKPLIVRFEDAVPPGERMTEFLLNEAARLLETDRYAVPANPARLVRVIVDTPDLPSGTVTMLGCADMEKSGPTTCMLMPTE